MQIDCDSCQVRGAGCGDCVVTYLLGAPPEGVQLDAEEQAAIEVLAGSGLVPPLRLVLAGEGVVDQSDTTPVEVRERWSGSRAVAARRATPSTRSRRVV